MSRTSSRPHYAQARTWTRFANRLRRASCPRFHPYHMKEDALRESVRLRSRALVLPSTLQDCEAAGLDRLAARTAAGDSYPEFVARVAQPDPRDPTADEVHLFLEVADRTGTHARKHALGKLPPEDALWVAPLVRLETDAYGTGPVLRYHVTGGQGETVHVAISRAHEAAAAWLDWADDRRAWAEAHAVAGESPYAYRVGYRDTVAPEAGYGAFLQGTDVYDGSAASETDRDDE